MDTEIFFGGENPLRVENCQADPTCYTYTSYSSMAYAQVCIAVWAWFQSRLRAVLIFPEKVKADI